MRYFTHALDVGAKPARGGLDQENEMKLKNEEGRLVIEPQTAAEHEVLQMLAGPAVVTKLCEEPAAGVAIGVGSSIKEWERAVAGSVADLLDGMPRASARRVLLEVLCRVDENPPVEPGDRFSAF